MREPGRSSRPIVPSSLRCAWSEGDVAVFVGTRERDLHQALAQTERIETEIGA